jgi:hypothetical protein
MSGTNIEGYRRWDLWEVVSSGDGGVWTLRIPGVILSRSHTQLSLRRNVKTPRRARSRSSRRCSGCWTHLARNAIRHPYCHSAVPEGHRGPNGTRPPKVGPSFTSFRTPLLTHPQPSHAREGDFFHKGVLQQLRLKEEPQNCEWVFARTCPRGRMPNENRSLILKVKVTLEAPITNLPQTWPVVPVPWKAKSTRSHGRCKLPTLVTGAWEAMYRT